MLLRIDTASSIPVYAQIVEQVKRAVASGALRSGEALPSLRETALNHRINPLTVSKAYKQLEYEGLVETRHGLGSFISENAKSPVEDFRRETIARELDQVVLDAYQLGVEFDEVRRILEERIESAETGFAGGKEDTRESRHRDR